VHFLIQWLPTMAVARIITVIKSKTSNYLFQRCGKELRKELWWWKLRTSWYYVNTVWAYGGEQTIREYIRNQGGNGYEVRYRQQIELGQLPLRTT
jgi:REP element-mobilizing transposase RayT